MRSGQLVKNIKATKANNKKAHFKRSALYMGMCLASQLVLAGPEGGAVVGGSGSISQSGSTTTILQNTDRMAIDWQSYDVAADERVHYIQPDSTSVSLNRILSNYGSTIHGRIDANGQVILVNPNGIFFSESSVVNAGGILASGLRLDPSNFMNGDFSFRALEGDGGVVINSGLLQAATGGSVNLLGRRVENNGLIQAELGTVSLAAGKEAVLHFDQSGMLGIQVTESVLQEELGLDAAVLNNGDIKAAGGKVLLSAAASRNVFSSAVNMGEGVATSVVVEEDGSFTLSAGANVENRGNVNVSATGSTEAGEVAVLGQNVDQRGSISADAEVQTAGHIELQAVDTTLVHGGSTLSAQSENTEGGNVYVFGNQVALLGASSISVSAAHGAGEILVGGDYRGENPWVSNASAVYFGPDALLNANANDSGIAGKIILWGDNLLRAYGTINARGFGLANGGFVETSSAQVDLDLFVNLNSANANSGEWLIDPYDIIIGNSNTRIDMINNVGGSQFDLFQPSAGALDTAGNASILNVNTLRDALNNGNTVTIQTTREGGDIGEANGDITLNAALDFDEREHAELILDADGNIDINFSISDSDTDDFDDSITLDFRAGGSIDIDANITTGGGSFTALGASFDSTGQTINTSASSQGGNVTITTTGNANLGTFTVNGSTGGTSSIGGVVNVTSAEGAINLNAGFDFSYTGNGANNQGYTLTLSAANGINVLGEIFDSAAGNRDSLNLNFQADSDFDGVGDLIVSEDIYTGGGNVVFSGANFSNTNFVINTDYSNSGADADSNTSNNGSVQITMSGNVTIHNITTDEDGDGDADITITGNNITINGAIDSRAGDFVLIGDNNENDIFTINSTASINGSGARYINDSVASTRGGNDTFNIHADLGAAINGGAGDDIFNIFVNVANTVTGGSGDDTLNLGYGDVAILATLDFTFDGGADNDTVSVGNILYPAQWQVSGPDSAQVDNIVLLDVESLVGSDGGADTFIVSGAFTGSINGRAGTDELRLTTATGGSWVLTNSNEGTLNTNLLFSGIETLTGSSATGDNLQGRNIDNTWNITAANQGNVDGVTFSGMENLTGGSSDDDFMFSDGSSISGTINGGGQTGEDTANYSNVTTAVNINLASGLGGLLNIEALTGNGTNSTLTGANGGQTWQINSDGSLDLQGASDVQGTVGGLAFYEFTSLIGGTGADTFNLNASTQASINGGAGADIFNVADNTLTISVTGGADNDRINYTGSNTVTWSTSGSNAGSLGATINFLEMEILSGGTGIDTIQGRNVVNAWTISGNESGSLDGLTFSEMEILQGGTNSDNFTMTASSTSTINGGLGTDSLQGRNAANTWTISGDRTGSVDGVSFIDIESLLGGSLADIFNVNVVTTSTIDGGAGTDTFNLLANSGQIRGGADGDTFNINAVISTALYGDAGVDRFFLNFSAGIVNGGDGNDIFTVSDNTISANLQGGNESDTLIYSGTAASQWNLIAANQGSFGSLASQDVQFSEMENLTGGTGNDTFAFADGVTTANFGTVNGGAGAGTDEIDFSSHLGALDISLGTLAGIELLTGNGISRLLGGDQATNWTITSINEGTVSYGATTTLFSGFSSLIGGLLGDTFNFDPVGRITNLVSGGAGAGVDTINGRDTDGLYTLTGTNSGVISDVGGIYVNEFQGIEILDAGTAGADALQAPNDTNVWTLSGLESGNIDGLNFSEMEILRGGAGVDTFNINTAISALLYGGANADIFNIGGSATVYGEAGADDFFISALGVTTNIDGGAGADIDELTYTGSTAASWLIDAEDAGRLAANIIFTEIETLVGGSGTDTFTFDPSGLLNGLVNGGGGSNDVLEGRASTSVYTLNGDNSGSISSGGIDYTDFSSIEVLRARSADDRLLATFAANTWQITGSGNGSRNAVLNFEGMEVLQGGSSVDNFTTTSSAHVISIIGGSNATDTLALSSNEAVTWNLTGATSGNFANNSNFIFAGIETLQGGSGDNSLQAQNIANTWTINGSGAGVLNGLNFSAMDTLLGGSGTDAFTTNATAYTIALNGGSDTNNTLSFSGNSTALWTLTAANQGSLGSLAFSSIQTLNGGSGTGSNVDTLRGPNVDSIWTIDGNNTGTVAGTRFNSMENLTGGTLTDVFGFDATAALISGTINGDAGSDTIQGRAATTSYTLTNNEAGTAAIGSTTYATFSDIENVEARGASDVLRGRDVSNTWTINGVNSVSISGIAFSAIENLTGGSQADAFVFNTADASISGTIDGAGDNTGNDSIRGRNTGNLFVITGAGAGNVQENGNPVTSFTGIEELRGGSGNDTLQSANVDMDWDITGSNQGSLATRNTGSNSYEFDFSGMENLRGSSAADEFTFSMASSVVTGLIDAGEGSNDGSTHDELILSGLTAGVVVSVGSTVTPGIVIFDTGPAPTQVNAHNFERVAAPSRSNVVDEAGYWLAINYPNAINLQVTGSTENNSQNINHGYLDLLNSSNNVVSNSRINFENFGSIQSGDGSFTSNVRPRILSNGSIQASYNISGRFQEGDGASNPNFSGEDISTFIVVEVTDKLESVTGNGNTLLLVNRNYDTMNFNVANTWTISDVNEGTFSLDSLPGHSVAFSGVNQLAGGNGDDQFNFIGSGTLIDGSIYGGGGVNRINSTSSVDLTFGISVLENIVPGIARPDDIANIDRLVNRAGIIDILNISTLAGNPAAGIETMLYSSDATDTTFTWAIGGANTLINNNTSARLDFTNIDRVAGGAANDIFNVADLAAMQMRFDGGAGADLLNLTNFSQAFVISLDSALPADIWVNGVETLSLPNQIHSLYAAGYNNTWTFTGENTGRLTYNDGVDQIVNFTNVAHAIGGSLQDIFIFDASGNVTGTLDGGADNGFDLDTINVNSGNSRDFIFQVSSTDSSGRVIDSGAQAVDLFGIEQLNANAARSNTLIGANVANIWLISDAGNDLTYSGTTLDFTSVNNLRGGSAQDRFTFDGAVVAGLVDGGTNAANQGDILSVENLDGTTVHIGNRVTSDLNVLGFETYNVTGNNLVLRADDVVNTWAVNNTNSGLINGAQFNGFMSLTGGSAGDNFVFGQNGQLSGVLDGGANPASGTANDTLDLQSLIANTVVSLDPTYTAANLFIARLETVSASNLNHTLVGANASNAWIVSEPNAGQINGMNFSGFANLLGRDQVDTFTFRELGDISGLVDGGSQPQDLRDVVDMRELSIVQVVVGDTSSGFVDIEEYIGNNTNARIVGENIENTWTINSVNGGTISDTSGRNITFRDFTSIVGGTVVDRFTITETGSVTGEILAGAGADRLTVMLGTGRNGEVNFVGGDGADTVVVEGGNLDTRFAANYRALAGGASTTDFVRTDLSFGLNYSGVETVNNNAYISTLTVNPLLGQANTIQLSDTAFTVGGQAPVNFTRAQSFLLNGAQGDALVISGLVDFENNIELRNVTVDASAGSLRAGQNLVFDRTGALGAANARVNIEAANLTLNRIAGAAYLGIEGNTNIAALTSPAGLVDILSNGAVTSTAELLSTGALNIVAGGDIRLSGLNNLSGALSLVSPDTVELNNSATNLAGIQAGNFILTARSLVDDNGAIIVGENFTLNGAAGSIVTLDHAQNSFGQIVLNSEGSVLLRDHSAAGVNIQGRALNGLDLLAEQAIIVNELNGSSINLVSENAAINALGVMAADNFIRLHGNGVQVSGPLSVNNNISGLAVDIDGGTGNVNLLAGINAGQTVPGDISIAGANITSGEGAHINARNIQFDSTGSINIASNVTANGTVNIFAAAMQWLGNILAPQAIANVQVGGAATLGGDWQFADATVDIGNQLTMSGGSSISSSTNLNVTTGTDLQVAALSAGDTLTLNVGGTVTDNDTQTINLTAPNLIATSQTGFGTFANSIETAVAVMDVVNTAGEVGVTNNQELLVNALINTGDIFLQNTQGNVTLNNLAEEDYNLDLTGTRAAGGVIDANYDLGDVRIEVLAGYLAANPQVSYQDRPELIGNTVSVVTRDGFGVRGRRIVVLAKDQLRVGGINGGGGGIRPRWGLGIPPVNGLVTDSDLADVGVLGSLADLFIEFAGEIDPAIFTNVTNYVYEDVSIRLPRDQLLEDEEDDDEEESWQRLEGNGG